MTAWLSGALSLALGGVLVVGLVIWPAYRRLQRAEFIRNYRWPPGLLDKLAAIIPASPARRRPSSPKACGSSFSPISTAGSAMSPCPRRWRTIWGTSFILYTRAYQDFCRQAFGGFLHHTPAVALAEGRKADNTGLRRVWLQCCREDGINPRSRRGCRALRAGCEAEYSRRLSLLSRLRAAAPQWRCRLAQCGGDFPTAPMTAERTAQRQQRQRRVG